MKCHSHASNFFSKQFHCIIHFIHFYPNADLHHQCRFLNMHINLVLSAQLNKSLSIIQLICKGQAAILRQNTLLPLTSIFKLTYRLIQTTNLLSTSKISDQSAELLKTQTLLAEVFEHSSFPLTPFIQCPSNNCQINGINRCLYCSRPKTKDIDIAETAVTGMNEIGH